MADANTELGGPSPEFPPTTANLVDQLRHPGDEARRRVMERLAQRYWKPVYHFLRLTYSKGNEDAKDLTQAFFLWLLERDLLLKYDPARSAFRTFLKGLLRNFAGNEHQALHRLKRGGGARLVALEAGPSDPADAASDPEAVFDRLWRKDVFDRAIDRVRRRCEAGRRLVPFLVFREHDLVPASPSYADLASKFGLKESDVRNYLSEIRRQVKAEVTAELSDVEGERGELAAEWKPYLKD